MMRHLRPTPSDRSPDCESGEAGALPGSEGEVVPDEDRVLQAGRPAKFGPKVTVRAAAAIAANGSSDSPLVPVARLARPADR